MNRFFEDLNLLEGGRHTRPGDSSSAERHLEVLDDLGRAMASAVDLDDLVRVILERLVEITEADRGLLLLASPSSKLRVFKGVDRYGEPVPGDDRGIYRRVAAEVMSTGSVCLREGVRDSSRNLTVSVLAVPLESHRGRFGVLCLESSGADGRLLPESRLLARLVAAQATQAIELFRLEEERRRADRIKLENEFLVRLSRRQEEQARVVEALNEKLEGQARELSGTSTFLKGILESSTEYAIVATDSQGTITAFNSGASNIYGWESRDVQMQESLEVLFRPQDTEQGLLRRMMAEASGTRGRFASEAVRLRKCGEEVPARVTMTAIRDREGRLLGFLDVSSDLTSEQELRQQLMLSEKMAALGTLSAGVAHEFNNILQGIIGFLSHALKATDYALWERAMRVSLEAANRASSITGRLQAFARPNVSGLQPVLLPELVDETLALVEQSFISDGVEVRREYDPDAPAVLADKSRLSQVILNLLTNARHAVAREAVRRVTVSTGVDDGWVVVRVADTGCGIPEAAHSRIFEPFYTTKGALGGKVFDGKVHGTGLGLAISSGIVLEHGGRIDLKSRPGEGAVFTVRLCPAEEEQDTRDSGTQAEASQAGKHARRAPSALRVLVVDDERVVRELLKEILEQRGHEVVTAKDGDEGLRVFTSEGGRFDAVVADYQMPGMDGKRLLEAIRQNGSQERTPRLVMVTGRLDGDMGQPEGVDHLLRKPFGTEAIIGAIEGR